MSTSVKEIIELAESLLESVQESSNEAVLRCSTSRAYYAALHAASLSLPDELQVSTEEKKGKSSHQVVIDAIVLWAKSLKPGRQEAITMARNLPKLKDARKHADYRLKADFTVEDARQSLKVAIATIDSAERASKRTLTLQA